MIIITIRLSISKSLIPTIYVETLFYSAVKRIFYLQTAE